MEMNEKYLNYTKKKNWRRDKEHKRDCACGGSDGGGDGSGQGTKNDYTQTSIYGNNK